MNLTLQGKAMAEAAVKAEISENILEINNIEVIYDHVILVLKGVSLSVPRLGILRCTFLPPRA